jgi:hypothetical protein
LDEVPLSGLDGRVKRIRVERARLAWEVAVSWWIEPGYAQRLADELRFG